MLICLYCLSHGDLKNCMLLFSHRVMSSSFATPWTVTCQAPRSMGFPRQKYWSALPFPTPGDLPNVGIEPVSSDLAGRLFTILPPGKPGLYVSCNKTQCILNIAYDLQSFLITAPKWLKFGKLLHGFETLWHKIKSKCESEALCWRASRNFIKISNVFWEFWNGNSRDFLWSRWNEIGYVKQYHWVLNSAK